MALVYATHVLVADNPVTPPLFCCMSPPVPLLHGMCVFPSGVGSSSSKRVAFPLSSFSPCRFSMWVPCLCTPASIVWRGYPRGGAPHPHSVSPRDEARVLTAWNDWQSWIREKDTW